ncbi:MAG: shikimate dehydrogenase, partial [Clostridia bacterium]|nr:shikimate dehydrogenase [Clostridia bacterium]
MQYGLIGRKLAHSFSKEIHESIGDYAYTLKELEPQELDDFMTQRDFKAINVTIPYKEAVMPYLDNISDFAQKIGAVNTIVNRDGKLYGYNTDCLG